MSKYIETFKEMGLSEKVLQAVESLGYTLPTPIQAQAIPQALAGRDILGIAQTGTGKTAAFTLPILCLLERGRARARMPRTLILEPTRELAAQAEESFLKCGVNHKLNVALLIGGMGFNDQETKIMRGADVLIATPGRLLDFAERGKLLLTALEVLVIDEADRMLDMGFIPDIEKICKLVPLNRQTLFFSATMPPEITRLAETFLTDPIRIETDRASSPARTIEQHFIQTEPGASKRDILRVILRTEKELKNAIIFCNRKRDVHILHKSLRRHGFQAGALHGDLDQRTRNAALDSFKNNETPFIVCSDVAARGLDIPEVSHVLNFDVPTHAEDYIHRIGRTGRAGCFGKAFTLVTSYDKKYIEGIEKLIHQKITCVNPPGSDSLPDLPAASRSSSPLATNIGAVASGVAGAAEAPTHAEASIRLPSTPDTSRGDRQRRHSRNKSANTPGTSPGTVPSTVPAPLPEVAAPGSSLTENGSQRHLSKSSPAVEGEESLRFQRIEEAYRVASGNENEIGRALPSGSGERAASNSMDKRRDFSRRSDRFPERAQEKSEGRTSGDYARQETRQDTRHETRQDFRAESRNDSKGGDHKGDTRGDARGDTRGDTRGDARSDARPDSRYEARPDMRGNGERRFNRYEREDPPVVGFGTHIPAFLLRSIKLKPQREITEE